MTSDVTQLIAELTSQRFYGSIEVKFEAGRIVLLKKTETVKPTEPSERSNARPNLNQPSTRQSETNNGKHYNATSR
jgi:hypothetical protein